MICAACGVQREPADLIAFFPVGHPELRRYVCRVTRPSPRSIVPCFRVAVGSILRHEIRAVAL